MDLLKKTACINGTWEYDGNSASEIYAYMKPNTVIIPENIIEYVSAEEWRRNVLKYFGKEWNV